MKTLKNTRDKHELHSESGVVVCGMAMPMSDMPEFQPGHWEEVKAIFEEVISCQSLKPQLVSATPEVSVLHHTIVNNLYNLPIVLFDVSGSNPNVMVELGMRLAFDKPVVIVKDTDTRYEFDTSIIEHVPYRRNLNYGSVQQFKAELGKKITDTLKVAGADSEYSPFLKHFRNLKPKGVPEAEVPLVEFLTARLDRIETLIEKPQGRDLAEVAPNHHYPGSFQAVESRFKLAIGAMDSIVRGWQVSGGESEDMTLPLLLALIDEKTGIRGTVTHFDLPIIQNQFSRVNAGSDVDSGQAIEEFLEKWKFWYAPSPTGMKRRLNAVLDVLRKVLETWDAKGKARGSLTFAELSKQADAMLQVTGAIACFHAGSIRDQLEMWKLGKEVAGGVYFRWVT